jgi:hypothetical protein
MIIIIIIWVRADPHEGVRVADRRPIGFSGQARAEDIGSLIRGVLWARALWAEPRCAARAGPAQESARTACS